jgi:uncharacterized protein YqeY
LSRSSDVRISAKATSAHSVDVTYVSYREQNVTVSCGHRNIASAVAEVAAGGSTGPSAMGAVMKLVSPQVSGRADGGAVAAAVKSALA